MRIFILTISLIMFSGHQADAQDSSLIGIKLFNEICFQNYSYPAKRKVILSSKFVKYEGKNEELFLNIFNVEVGQAWSAKFPNAVFSIILDYKNNNCYMVSSQEAQTNIHNLVRGMSENAKIKYEEYKEVVSYMKPETKEGTKVSGFKVTKNNKSIMNIVAVTQDNPINNQPAIILALEAY